MAKKENWLDKFARSQDAKMKKTASMKKTEKFILAKSDMLKDVKNDDVVKYNGMTCKVINADYEDEIGMGVVIEKVGQEYARTNPGNVYDIDAQTTETTAYETAATETRTQIEAENSVDGTKGDTRPMRRSFRETFEKVMTDAIVPVEEAVVEEAPVEEPTVEIPVEESVVEEVSVEDDDMVDIDIDSYVEATVEETEEVLAEAEEVIKDSVPAKYVRAILSKMASKLKNEGLEVKFDSKVTREMARKTASVVTEVSKEDIDEVVEKMSKAIVAEVEDTLAELDDIVDGDITANCVDENEVKTAVEEKLCNEGISCRLARKNVVEKITTASKEETKKVTLMDSIMNTVRTKK